jgi:nitrite reductase/ring-hydroxylating ferredoxin subunit
MYISVEQPTRSIRSAPAGEGTRWVVVGGEGHQPGEDPANERRYAALAAFLRDRFDCESEYEWSTHDYTPADRLPYIGQLRRRDDRIWTATGFAKWGMTKGTVAAQIIADAILGRQNPWAEVYDANRLHVRHSAPAIVRENAHVAARFFGDRLRRGAGREAAERLKPGEGGIVRVRGRHYAVSRDDAGTLHSLSARCTHLGCLVRWNPADRIWECPCHGSRFASDGTVIGGPATESLPCQRVP